MCIWAATAAWRNVATQKHLGFTLILTNAQFSMVSITKNVSKIIKNRKIDVASCAWSRSDRNYPEFLYQEKKALLGAMEKK